MFGYLLYKIVCNLAGFLYPAYASFKAIKANDTKIILPWLIYWIVMAFFTLGEGIADSLIFWFPFYYEMKILFILCTGVEWGRHGLATLQELGQQIIKGRTSF
ncbi:unnamed protein product [Rhizophagus irregularis]|nr:unnamed protein product [Rhizophagus irregularis]